MTIGVEDPADCVLDQAARTLCIEVGEDVWNEWPLAGSRYTCVARVRKGEARVEGASCGVTPIDARRRAVMECIERYSQFCCEPSHLCVATGRALGASAVSPLAFGLYSDSQYGAGCFPFAKYVDTDPMPWAKVTAVNGQGDRYVPVAFAYPHFVTAQPPLVAETSSGTAAHTAPASAQLASLCELIERDSLLLFWHRQPPTRAWPVSQLSSEAIHDIEAIRAMGYVVVLCDLTYDLGIPCALALALCGDRIAHGSGCHPSMRQAANHALREMSTLLRWQQRHWEAPRNLLRLEQVTSAAAHQALYDGGPLHSLFRKVLDRAMHLGQGCNLSTTTCEVSDERSLDFVVDRLQQCGYTLYESDLTPPEVRSLGIRVTRSFVPGLIPLYFGYDRIRFACQRLSGRASPGRLGNLLPHFMS